MKVTVVIDNCVPPSAARPFVGEHGLSLLVEHQGARILFDTGQSGAVVHNLGLLGVPPASLDMLVLSHGHYDHTGGLAAVLQHAGRPLPVYAHRSVLKPRISTAGGRRPVGIPFRAPELGALGAQWRFTDRPVELLPGLWHSGEIPRRTRHEEGDQSLLAGDGDGPFHPDLVEDDSALFLAGEGGLCVVGGCAHAGVINTVRHGLEVTGRSRLDAWIGGTHLGPLAPDQQGTTLDQLLELAPARIAANHCTGFAMMAVLRERLGPRFVPAFVGTALEVGTS